MRDELNALFDLARMYGIEPSYYDGLGVHRTAPPETILAALQALGAPVETPADAAAFLDRRNEEIHAQVIQPVIVAWQDEPVQAPIRLVSSIGDAAEIVWRLELEGGDSMSGVARPGDLALRSQDHGAGRNCETRLLSPAERLPLGFHRLELEIGKRRASAHLIAAPRRAYAAAGDSERRRRWGVFSPLYALKSEDNWGCGDFWDLERLVEWTSSLGGSFVGSLPFFAAFLDAPFDPSPYAPVSRLFWNELFVRPERSSEWSGCEEARRLFQSPEFQKELERARSGERVDYRRVMKLKRSVLEVLARRFFESSSHQEGFTRFLVERPDVTDYAAFRSAVEQSGAPPRDWTGASRDGTLLDFAKDTPESRYHLYVQHLAHQQIGLLKARSEERDCGLYMDLPLGAHPEGYDVWAFPEAFARGVAGGAPPDDFFSSGQNWGFPPLNPLASRAQGHDYLRRCISNLMDRSHLLRIDHVMSLHRLFWIPDGVSAAEGVYVHYPFEELYAVVNLESHRRRCAVVGEDLGTVPPVVRERMDAHGLLRMYVGQFSVRPNAEDAVKPAPEGVVAALNTHDMLPFAAFWRGHDIALRKEMGFLDESEAHAQEQERRKLCRALMLRFGVEGDPNDAEVQLETLRLWMYELASAPCRFLMVNLEDLWLETAPQNVPGTGAERPNWTRKHHHSLEDFCRNDAILDTLEEIDIRRSRKEIADHERTKQE